MKLQNQWVKTIKGHLPGAGILHIEWGSVIAQLEFYQCRDQREELRPWQRSWGRRLGIGKGRIEPQESPWQFSSIYPQNQSLPTFCFVLSPTPLTLRGAVPHYLSEKRISLQLQLIIPGCDSVSTYKLLWKSSSLPEWVFPATCDCSEPPNCERQEMF